ncbi:MAG: hypothetical protein JWN82_616 [Candidatus Saccharibacteria bacterium]|nr:hypothetical protein [Candidatus Saccharibacteria bacterium]
MGADSENFYVRPLFYEVLSVGFRPTSDAQKRVHTLARLSVAATNRGTFAIEGEPGGKTTYPTFVYQPSWAPGVQCKVDGEWTGFERVHAVMYGIHLANNSGNTLYLSNPDPSTLEIGTAMSDMEYDLDLGEKMKTGQLAVRSAVEQFFKISQ